MDTHDDRTAESPQAGRAGGQNSAEVAAGGAVRPGTYVMADQPVGVRLCSMAAALEILGERWTLPALREMAYGVHQFSRIAGFTGASRDILADRLRKLQDAGIVERRRYSEHPPRYEYHLAQAGHELFPVMLALREWGDKWAVSAPPLDFRHSCGHPPVTELRCRHCEEPVTRESLTPLHADHRPERRGADSAGPGAAREPRTE